MNKATIGAIWTGTVALVVIAVSMVVMLLVDFQIVTPPADPTQQSIAFIAENIDGMDAAIRGGFGQFGPLNALNGIEGDLSGLEKRLSCIYAAMEGQWRSGC